ncbi:MAG: DUF4157 domain-containing protein [Saccharothrix sp.]|nr:DUF4157 domain-containing protein [Saccharothrix sp.]
MLKYYFGAMKPRTAGPAATTSVEAGPAQAEGSSSAEQLALQLAPGTGSAAVAATGAERSAVQDVVSSPGRRLDETTRGEMETALGADFSDVRVHSDPVARRSASDLGARAYTAGEHVVVGDGGTDRHTLAHELSHVIQQRQGPVAGTDRGDGLVVSDPNDTFERAAEADATRTTVDPGPGPRFGHHRTTGGRHSVQRMVEPDTGPSSEPASTGGEEPTKPAVIIQPGYASGDQFAVAALLIAEPDRHVYITYKEVDKKSTQEAAEKRKQFYDESGVGKRARVVKDTELDKSLEEYHGKVYKAASSRQQQKRPGKFQIDLETVTESVGKKFEEKEYADFLRREIRKKWIPSAVAGDGGDQDDWVREWLDVRGVSDVDKKEIAILWSRFSGKMGEAHVEHDTGFLAMRQIIEQIGELDYVLIVGDRGGKDKFEKLAEYYQDIKSFGGLNAHVVDMTEFWNDEDFKRRSSADGEKKSTRTDQFRVFDYLNRKAHARHLGFRSGNLEAMALMGFTVRYLEEPNSSGGPRMEAFHGTQIGYERLLIQQPPTAAGQNELVRRMELGKDAKEQSYEEWKSKKVEVLFKGFTEADLSTIKAYLVHGNPAIDLNRDMIREVCALESHPSLPVLDEQARRFRARAKGLRDSARKLAGTVGGSDSNVKKKEHEAEGNDERAMEKEREALKLVMVGIDELVEHWLESEGEVALLRALYLFAPHVIGRLVGASTISP